MTALWVIVACGALSIVYGIWATRSVMSADAGSEKMQEISAAVAEGAQAYLKRQYTTIGMVGIVIFIILGIFLGWLVAVGSFSSGQVLAAFGWTAVNGVVFPFILVAGAMLVWLSLRKRLRTA